jgi:hypothetical protein
MELDVIYEIPVPFALLQRDSMVKKAGDLEVRIASLDHLKIMKEKK